nr:isoform 2 of cullin-associated nedd8-dissociated protein 1 [Quercus suber]
MLELTIECHKRFEVIGQQSVDKVEFQDFSVEKILKFLFNHCESDEEGVRNVVAECLGKIALVEPSKLVPALKVRTTSPTAFTRATVVIAVKYSIVERSEKIDEIIYPGISHSRIIATFYDQTIVKAAFECVDTLLDSCLDQVNPSSFIVPYLKSGLDSSTTSLDSLLDHCDVKMPCHLIPSKLADKCPSAVLSVLDSLVDPLQKTINFKPKQDAVRQELDCNEDMICSALRAIASLNRIR